jgi:chaperonin GroEL
MSKTIIYGNDAKQSIRQGIDAVANAVKVTLGPKGQTVLIDANYEEGKITKDGVSVAQAIDLKDKVMNAGAKIIKKVASKTAADAGDGTTTATVIAQYIVENGAKLIASGVNPMEMKKGVDCAVKDAIKYFKDNSKKVVDADELREIATISANGDAEIGKIVADVITEVGAEGVVTIETSKTFETYVDKVSGLKFDRGYISPYFVTDLNKGLAILDNPVILVTDQTISTLKQLQKVLEYASLNNRSIFIICNDLQGEALTFSVINKMRGTLKVCAVKCPAFGDRKTKELEDIAVLTGATVVAQDKGYSLDSEGIIDALGSAERVTVDSKSSTIVNGTGNKTAIDERTALIRSEIENETSKYNKDILKTRLAKLVGGVAILNVGAITEVELNEKKDRIDDALCAARAANEEGTLPGGGVAYINASMSIANTSFDSPVNPDFRAGYQLLIDALSAPLAQIVNNGYGDGMGNVVVSRIIDKKKEEQDFSTYGYNARKGDYCDLREEGIIDPAKVCRVALENAASIAGMFLTTGCIIIDEPEEKKSNENQM